MLKHVILICPLLIPLSRASGQVQPNKDAVPVEVVATASEYVPRSTTVSHPGHSYTNCLGSTSYFGRFNIDGDSGHFSGTADTDTRCKTIFSPPTETTLATYRKVSYTVAKSGQALYLLACTAAWKPSAGTRLRAALAAGVHTQEEHDLGESQQKAQQILSTGPGHWSDCPAFSLEAKYILRIASTSDARLENSTGGKPIKLEYLGSAPSPPSDSPGLQSAGKAVGAKVHITSSPSGGEIYVDGKFFGNTPSDITVAAGEHIVKVTIGGKEWSRSVQITAGEIRLHADMGKL